MRCLYVDTSAVFHAYRAGGTQLLDAYAKLARAKGFTLVVTDVVLDEIRDGPRTRVLHIEPWLAKNAVEVPTNEANALAAFRAGTNPLYQLKDRGDRSILEHLTADPRTAHTSAIFADDRGFRNAGVMRAHSTRVGFEIERIVLTNPDMLNSALKERVLDRNEYGKYRRRYRMKLPPFKSSSNNYSSELDGKFLTNAEADLLWKGKTSRGLKVLGAFGRVMAVVGTGMLVIDGLTSAARASEQIDRGDREGAARTLAEFAGRAGGALLYAQVGGLVGGIPGAIAGGILGAFLGEKAAVRLLDLATGHVEPIKLGGGETVDPRLDNRSTRVFQDERIRALQNEMIEAGYSPREVNAVCMTLDQKLAVEARATSPSLTQVFNDMAREIPADVPHSDASAGFRAETATRRVELKTEVKVVGFGSRSDDSGENEAGGEGILPGPVSSSAHEELGAPPANSVTAGGSVSSELDERTDGRAASAEHGEPVADAKREVEAAAKQSIDEPVNRTAHPDQEQPRPSGDNLTNDRAVDVEHSGTVTGVMREPEATTDQVLDGTLGLEKGTEPEAHSIVGTHLGGQAEPASVSPEPVDPAALGAPPGHDDGGRGGEPQATAELHGNVLGSHSALQDDQVLDGALDPEKGTEPQADSIVGTHFGGQAEPASVSAEPVDPAALGAPPGHDDGGRGGEPSATAELHGTVVGSHSALQDDQVLDGALGPEKGTEPQADSIVGTHFGGQAEPASVSAEPVDPAALGAPPGHDDSGRGGEPQATAELHGTVVGSHSALQDDQVLDGTLDPETGTELEADSIVGTHFGGQAEPASVSAEPVGPTATGEPPGHDDGGRGGEPQATAELHGTVVGSHSALQDDQVLDGALDPAKGTEPQADSIVGTHFGGQAEPTSVSPEPVDRGASPDDDDGRGGAPQATLELHGTVVGSHSALQDDQVRNGTPDLEEGRELPADPTGGTHSTENEQLDGEHQQEHPEDNDLDEAEAARSDAEQDDDLSKEDESEIDGDADREAEEDNEEPSSESGVEDDVDFEEDDIDDDDLDDEADDEEFSSESELDDDANEEEFTEDEMADADSDDEAEEEELAFAADDDADDDDPWGPSEDDLDGEAVDDQQDNEPPSHDDYYIEFGATEDDRQEDEQGEDAPADDDSPPDDGSHDQWNDPDHDDDNEDDDDSYAPDHQWEDDDDNNNNDDNNSGDGHGSDDYSNSDDEE